MSDLRIEARQLTKRYGSLVAVNELSFEVEAGEVLGFLGPNGAGKSTTMKMLTGFLTPTAGTAVVNGHDIVITSAHKSDSNHHAKKDDDSSSSTTPIIINTGDVQVLKGMGMPKRHYKHKHDHHSDDSDHLHYVGDDPNKKEIVGDSKKFGDLYVQFNVELPKSSSQRAVNPLTEEERSELSRLLRKLEGKKEDTSHDKNDRKPSKKGKVADPGGGSEEYQYQLQQAKATDFGRASGRVTLEKDDHSGHHEDGFHNPFGGSSFFQQSGGRGFTYFSSSSFGDDGGQQECNQM